MYRLNISRKKGAAIAEAAASMVVMIPLMVTLIFVCLEVSFGCFLHENLAQAARKAARDLAIQYGADPKIVESRSKQDALVFDQIRINNIVNSSLQFDDPVFQTGNVPHTVTVTVRYLSNQYDLPKFPYPDPLGIGQSYQPVARSTYRLE